MALLFSYGSNHPGQLAQRLGHDVEGRGAYAPGWQRAFRGWSTKWEGGTATLVKKRGGVTYGYVTDLPARDFAVLDRFEGLGVHYERALIDVFVGDDRRKSRAIAYLSLSKDFNPPSEAYLRAIVKTVSPFWQGANSTVDFPIR